MARKDYTGLQGTAEKLINRFGKDATLLQPGTPDSGADPWDPGENVPSETAIIVTETAFGYSYRASGVVKEGDKMLLVSTSAGVAPSIGDEIALESDTYQVVTVDVLRPGGTTLLYKTHVRWSSGLRPGVGVGQLLLENGAGLLLEGGGALLLE